VNTCGALTGKIEYLVFFCNNLWVSGLSCKLKFISFHFSNFTCQYCTNNYVF